MSLAVPILPPFRPLFLAGQPQAIEADSVKMRHRLAKAGFWHQSPGLLQEAWCKKAPPNAALVGERTWEAKAREHRSNSAPPPAPAPDALQMLRGKAAEIGLLVQYGHQGFLPNKRQQMMSGLAVIEAAQFVAHLVRVPSLSDSLCGCAHATWAASHCCLSCSVSRIHHRRGVWCSVQVKERSEGREVYSTPGASSGNTRHPIGWRDFADIAVKWRQLSEPNDQVGWSICLV
jgi:hypothetical protein